MTEDSPKQSTVLFADICRSTTLFEQLGDRAALDVVMQTLELAGEISRQNKGTVIGTIGDEVMCIFSSPENALFTALQIHSKIQQNSLMQQHQLAMRVGINSGSVVNTSNSVYGDTVNIAARLAQMAKGNQSLVSSETIAAIGDKFDNQLRLIGQIKVQGKAGAIEVHELLEQDAIEAITEVSAIGELANRSFLMTATYQNRQIRFTPMLVRYVFGRSTECDQIIDHATVSRQHAEILYRNGRFLLRDFSTNGSQVVQDGQTRRLHRSSMTLNGNGKIFLGRTLNQHQYCIEFTCDGSR